MRRFSRMLISKYVHKSIIVMNSIDTGFSRNVFEAVQKTLGTRFIGSKTRQNTPARFLNIIKQELHFALHPETLLAGRGMGLLNNILYGEAPHRGLKIIPLSNLYHPLSFCKDTPKEGEDYSHQSFPSNFFQELDLRFYYPF